MSVFHNNALIGASGNQGVEEYSISRSVRFNSSDSAYLSRTPASAGNRRTWTWAGWVKRAKLGAIQNIFDAAESGTSNPRTDISFGSSDTFNFQVNPTGSAWLTLATTQVFRDVSAWGHLVIAVDTTQTTDTNRVKCYWNGTQITQFSTAQYPSQNTDLPINNSWPHSIGRYQAGATNYFNGYLADIHFIDGQALDPTSFTEVSATTGQLIPKAYTGSYGTNGFHLPFSDNSTAASLGTDTSGNGNTWTVNNIQTSGLRYSDNLTTDNGTFLASYPGRNAFDGSIVTAALTSTNGGAGCYMELTVNSGWNWTGNVEIYANTGASQTYSVNGGAATSFNGSTWTTVSTSGGSVTSIRIARTAGYAVLSAIRVNGVILIDSFDGDNDSLVDTPVSSGTDTGTGGQVTGNYCTLNPLTTAGGTLSNGNLDWAPSGNNASTWSTFAVNTGKWYFEFTKNSGDTALFLSQSPRFNSFQPDSTTTGLSIYMYSSGSSNVFWYNGSSAQSFPSGWGSVANGDVIGVLLDFTAGTITIRRNNDSANQAAYTMNSALYAAPLHVGYSVTSTWAAGSFNWNFGQRPFAYTVSGYKCLCDTNLPAPVVAKPSEYMDVKLYTGNGSTQTISGLEFSPDLVWVKVRGPSTSSHRLTDKVRGDGYSLFSNLTNQEDFQNASGYISALNSDGFTVVGGTGTNAASNTYVGWAWDGGSSTVTNTAGSITSQVRANASAGFSVVTFTYTTSGSVGHGLGVAPALIIKKNRTSVSAGYENWHVYHSSLGSGKYIMLNSTSASGNATPGWGTVNSTTFDANASFFDSSTFVAYCFAPVSGYSSFGSYVGNGSTDGPFVYTGFRPKFIMVKVSSTTGNWIMYDSSRDEYNVVSGRLYPNLSNAEDTATASYDFLSNGFKNRASGATNTNGATYIWAAFAESPFQYARAR